MTVISADGHIDIGFIPDDIFKENAPAAFKEQGTDDHRAPPEAAGRRLSGSELSAHVAELLPHG